MDFTQLLGFVLWEHSRDLLQMRMSILHYIFLQQKDIFEGEKGTFAGQKYDLNKASTGASAASSFVQMINEYSSHLL